MTKHVNKMANHKRIASNVLRKSSKLNKSGVYKDKQSKVRECDMCDGEYACICEEKDC